MSAPLTLPARCAQEVPAIVSDQPRVADLGPPFTVRVLVPRAVSFRFSTMVSMVRLLVQVIPAPRQTISSSNMNHDFFAVRSLLQASSCIPAAPQLPSAAPPTQL